MQYSHSSIHVNQQNCPILEINSAKTPFYNCAWEFACFEYVLSGTDETYLIGSNGTIQLGGILSEPYANDIDLKWTISAPKDCRILFLVEFYDIEYQQDCLYDYLRIIDLNPDPNVHQKTMNLCGYSSIKDSWAVSANRAMVMFHSDFNTAGRGFIIQWQRVRMVAVSSFTAPSGYFSSINYPISYLNNVSYKSLIQVAEGFRVWLEFVDFSLEVDPENPDACGDYVEVFMDNSRSQRLCGNQAYDELWRLRYLSYGNTMSVEFHTDHKGNSRGYELKYKAGKSHSWLFGDGSDF